MDKVLVVGAGSIGRRHIQCLKELGIANVYVCEPVEANRKQVCNMFDICDIFTDIEHSLINTYDGAIVCVPNHLHAEAVIPIIKHDIPVLLEKPVGANLEMARRIQEAVHVQGALCQVGYCMRFGSALMWIHNLLRSGGLGKIYSADVVVGQYLPDWRPGTDYTKAYSAIRSQGGGVCLDISHELDYFRWLFGEPCEIQSQVKKISHLQIDVEDIAEAIVYTQNGVLGRIHLDYLSRTKRRQLYIVAEKGDLQFDFVSGTLQIFEAGGEFWKYRRFNDVVNLEYKRQFQHFMECVGNSTKPLVDIDDAIKTLEFALKIRNNCKY